MKLLLDTHVLVWWLIDSPRICDALKERIDDPAATVFVSAASMWEISTKHRLGFYREAAELAMNMPEFIRDWRFTPLPVTIAHGCRAGLLPGAHKDPFDRMLAAQSILEEADLVTTDLALAALGAKILWV